MCGRGTIVRHMIKLGIVTLKRMNTIKKVFNNVAGLENANIGDRIITDCMKKLVLGKAPFRGPQALQEKHKAEVILHR